MHVHSVICVPIFVPKDGIVLDSIGTYVLEFKRNQVDVDFQKFLTQKVLISLFVTDSVTSAGKY